MKTVLYYFSGTGNSLQVARDLACELGDAKVIPVSKAIINGAVAADAERVGIIFPVYMFGIPLIIADFIKKLKLNDTQYVFAVATYGGLLGNALGMIGERLKERGIRLSAGFALVMPGNYTPLYGAIEKDKQEKIFLKEKDRVRKIGEIVKEGRPWRIEKSSFLVNLIFSGLLYNSCSAQIRKMDKSFWADSKCNSCGICSKVCPVSNIEMVKAKPKWLGKCEQCMACLQWCPQEAIQFGKKTIGRKRYRNPGVTVQDFINV